MFYRLFKDKSEHPEWGGATYLYETDKNGTPKRKLVVYENSKIFGYDTGNRSDAAGSLEEKSLYSDKKDRREWAKCRIGKREFEKAWRQPESVPVNPHQDALNKVHIAGKWTTALGILNVVVGLILSYAIYHKQGVDVTAKHWALAYYFVFDVFIGLGVLSIGILLQRTTEQKLAQVLKLITLIILLIFTVPLLNLMLGGDGSIGVLGLVVFYQILKAQRKTVQLGYATSIQYRLTVLVAALLIVLAGALLLPHLKSQLVNKPASSSTTTTKTKPAKHFTSTQAASSLSDATSITQAGQALQSFASQYNIKLQVASAPGAITSAASSYDAITNNDLSTLKSYGSLWINEWAKYPVDWVQHSKLQTIIFVNNLSTNSGVGTSTADPAHQTLYYNVETPSDVAHTDIHATFFTLITYNDFGSYTPSDTTWSSYNTPGFAYGGYDSYCQDPDHSSNCDTEHHWEGFVDYQATTSVHADKTELYSYLMADDKFNELKSWLPNDPILQNKTHYLISYISHYSPEMQSNYYSEVNP